MAVYGELGRVPLIVIREVRILKFWFKMLSDPYTLLYKVYKQQVQQVQNVNNNRNMKCWSSNIMSLLNELGFSYLWNDQALSRSQLNMAIQRIYDHFLQEYYASYNISSKMDVFKTITKHFKLEKYISCVDIEKHRVALSRLRCSAHKLIIEEGRYRGGGARNERVCP